MIHLNDILDALLADGGTVVSIEFAPCKNCDCYHVISHGNDEHLCEQCSPDAIEHIVAEKLLSALVVDSDGVVD